MSPSKSFREAEDKRKAEREAERAEERREEARQRALDEQRELEQEDERDAQREEDRKQAAREQEAQDARDAERRQQLLDRLRVQRHDEQRERERTEQRQDEQRQARRDADRDESTQARARDGREQQRAQERLDEQRTQARQQGAAEERRQGQLTAQRDEQKAAARSDERDAQQRAERADARRAEHSQDARAAERRDEQAQNARTEARADERRSQQRDERQSEARAARQDEARRSDRASATPARSPAPRPSRGTQRIPTGVLSGSLPWLRVRGRYVVDEAKQVVHLRGVGLPGFERTVDRSGTFMPAASDGELEQIAQWGANAIVVPIAQDLATFGTMSAPPAAYFAALDATINAASAFGLYTIVQLARLHSLFPVARSDGGLSFDPPLPEYASVDMWGTLAQRYSREPAVLFDLFANPRDPAPEDPTHAFLPQLRPTIWRNWVLAMLGEIRRSHPAALVIVRGANASLAGLPVTYDDGSLPSALVYAINATPEAVTARFSELRTFSRAHPLAIASWAVTAADEKHVDAYSSRFARYGIHWMLQDARGRNAALVQPRKQTLRPTRLGRAASRALARPQPPDAGIDPTLREEGRAGAAPVTAIPAALQQAMPPQASTPPPPTPALPAVIDRYGNYALRNGDHDLGAVYDGTARTAAAGDLLPITGALGYVEQLQTDLRELGFRLVGTVDKQFGWATEFALREFQSYAKMAFAAQEVVPAPPGATTYVDRLQQVAIPASEQYAGPVSGVANDATRVALTHWLSKGWRCPVVIEAWTMQAGARSALVAENIWRHDEVANSAPRMFAWDVSGHYTYPAGHAAGDRVVLGDYQTYLTWSGPRSIPPNHTWPEVELLPESLVGSAFSALSASAQSTFKVVRAASEVECLGFFDSLNAYDNAFISLGPCHWILGNASTQHVVSDGELPGYLAYLKYAEPAVLGDAMQFFGLQPDREWIDSAGVASGQALFDKGQRKYLGWLQLQKESGWDDAPRQEAVANYFKTWHWFYRWQMAGRSMSAFRTRMWDMARIRLRDVLAAPWGTGITAIAQPGGGTRPVTIGDVYTSERAVALLLRWHIRFPAYLVSGGQAAAQLRNAFTKAAITSTTDPTQWTDAEETALIQGIMDEVAAINNADFTNTMAYVHDWATWATGTPPHNPRGYALATTIPPHAATRGSFTLDSTGLPPAPAYT